MSYLIIHG